ncbi:MAG: ribonuclease III [Alphaproteobacteria bacterium]|nr:ribonuclease III [Alphaproteobacteria bacterium]
MTQRDRAEPWARDTLGHGFGDAGLLRVALTHSGAPAGGQHFQRLEFLGDRVLALALAEHLMDTYPDDAEGDLARRHAALVSREALAAVASSCGLEQVATMPSVDDPTAARGRVVILADTLEAVLAAVYLDAGWDAARRAVLRLWHQLLGHRDEAPKDPKTRLQEWTQARGAGLPSYRTHRAEGPDHAPAFVAEVTVAGAGAATARGPSKRAAERAAAAALLECLVP